MVVWVALVLAQSLGLVHRIVHAPVLMHASVTAPAAADAGARHGTEWLKALFAGHSSEHGCDLYDQSAHADVMPVALLAPVVLVPLLPSCAAPAGPMLAVQATGFLARGPPLNG